MEKETAEQDFMNVWTPTLVSFTKWALKKALEWNIHKLYFLARDAFMSYQIASKIIEQEQLPLRCQYLKCSRYAWRMAERYLSETDDVEKLCIGGIHVTLRKILKRGGLTDQEAENIADRLKKKEQLDRQLAYNEIIRLKQQLKACEELRHLLHSKSADAYRRTLCYLEQEGLFTQEKVAIIDSGWTGSLQQTLNRLLKSVPGGRRIEIHGFYFGLYELPGEADPAKYHTYYFAPYRNIERKVRFSNCLFEAVCSAEEGMTVSYQEYDGRIVPVYETERNPNEERMKSNIAEVLRVCSDPGLLARMELPLNEVTKRLERLMSKPTVGQVEIYGNYLFSDDVTSGSLQPVAAVLRKEELKNWNIVKRFLLMKGILKESYRDSAWPEGSIVRLGVHTRYYLWHCRMYKRMIYLRKRIRAWR